MASDTESQNGNSDSESGPGLAERLAASFDQPGNNATLADLREVFSPSAADADIGADNLISRLFVNHSLKLPSL
jgi:hypothetical protein